MPNARFDKELEENVEASRDYRRNDERANEQAWEIVAILARRQDEAHNKSRRYSGRKQGPEATATKQALQQTLLYATTPTAGSGRTRRHPRPRADDNTPKYLSYATNRSQTRLGHAQR